MQRRHQPWAVFFTFALLGPLVPVTAFLPVGLVQGGNTLDPGPLWFWLFGALAGYVAGGVPALLTGALSAIVSGRVSHPAAYVAISVAIGAFVSSLLGGLFGTDAARYLGLAGAGSALVCALLTCRYRYRSAPSAA